MTVATILADGPLSSFWEKLTFLKLENRVVKADRIWRHRHLPLLT